MSISSIGIGSGVLTSDLIDKLVSAEREPTELRLDRRQSDIEARLSAFSRVQSAMTDLRLPARILSNPDALGELSATSSNSAFSATASNGAATGNYQLEVTQLARAQTLAGPSFTSPDDPVGTGTLTFTINGQDTNVLVNSGNNSLTGLRDAVNNARIGVTATIIDTGNGFQLSFMADESGSAGAMSISVSDQDGNNTDTSGLSRFSFTAGAENLTETTTAEDAALKLNGVAITRSSNSIDDLLEGVTIELTGTNTGNPGVLGVSRDLSGAADRVQEFVDKFNALQAIVNEVTAFDPSTGKGEVLMGDNTLRTMTNQIRSIIGNPVSGLESANVRSLAEVGISTNRETGERMFNAVTFEKKMTDYPDDVVALFATQGRTSDENVSFLTRGVAPAGTYDVEVTQVATRGSYSGNLDLSAGVTIDADNDSFQLAVDGVASDPITLAAGTYTASELVTLLQQAIDADASLTGAGISVSVGLDANNQLTLTSGSYGSSSTVEFTAVDTTTLATLGLDLGAGTAGVDVAGKINGEDAVGSGRKLRLDGGDYSGLAVEVAGSTTGSLGSVTVIDGIAEQMIDVLDNLLGFEGAIQVKNQSLNEELAAVANDRQQMEARLASTRSRLEKQFIAADILVSRFNSTADYIGNQLDALTKSMSGGD